MFCALPQRGIQSPEQGPGFHIPAPPQIVCQLWKSRYLGRDFGIKRCHDYEFHPNMIVVPEPAPDRLTKQHSRTIPARRPKNYSIVRCIVQSDEKFRVGDGLHGVRQVKGFTPTIGLKLRARLQCSTDDEVGRVSHAPIKMPWCQEIDV